MKRTKIKQKEQKSHLKPYQQPGLKKLGGLITDTLPGGSKNAEGNSGKGRRT